MHDLLPEILRRSTAREPLAVCTLVRTRGSTPQKPGACMLVLQGGQTLGTIGGGCVEAEVRSRALNLFIQGGSHLFTFKLDDDHGWDDGLLCGGTMDVAIQVVDSPQTVVSFQSASDQLAAGHVAELITAVGEEKFSRTIDPIPRLLIAGAGHVGSALATISATMDFDVTVIDDRPDYCSPDRFPKAVKCRVGDIDRELTNSQINPATYVVIVTRGHRNDGRALAAVVRSDARYIGLIGSKRKVLTIFADLLATGVPRDLLEKVHAPIGLAIGAVTPGEIAASIAAELIAARRGANPPFSTMQLHSDQINRL